MVYFYVTNVDIVNKELSVLDIRDNTIQDIPYSEGVRAMKIGLTIDGVSRSQDGKWHFRKSQNIPESINKNLQPDVILSSNGEPPIVNPKNTTTLNNKVTEASTHPQNMMPDVVLSNGGFAPFKPKEKKMLVAALGRKFIEQAQANEFDYDFEDGAELEDAIEECTSADGTIIGFKCLIDLQHKDTKNAKYPMFTIEFGWNALSNKYYIETYNSMYANSIRKCGISSENYETLSPHWFCYDEFVKRVNESKKNAQEEKTITLSPVADANLI